MLILHLLKSAMKIYWNQCPLADQALHNSSWKGTYWKCCTLSLMIVSLLPFSSTFSFSSLRHYSCLGWKASPWTPWIYWVCSENSLAVSLKKSLRQQYCLVKRRLLGQAIWAYTVKQLCWHLWCEKDNGHWLPWQSAAYPLSPCHGQQWFLLDSLAMDDDWNFIQRPKVKMPSSFGDFFRINLIHQYYLSGPRHFSYCFTDPFTWCLQNTESVLITFVSYLYLNMF